MSCDTELLPTCVIEDRVALIRFNDPERFNPIGEQVARKLLRDVEQLKTSCDIDCLVITGSGKAFSAGGNIEAFNDGLKNPQRYSEYVQNVLMKELGNPLILALHEFPKPVICAVNGIAAGMGFSLALAADIILASTSASFIAPFMPKLALIPDSGMTWHLPRLIGKSRAMMATLLGEPISAKQAEEWGMVWACVEETELILETNRLAKRLARLPMHGITELRNAYVASASNDLASQLEYEAQRQGELVRKAEFIEGVEAFIAKRPPDFSK